MQTITIEKRNVYGKENMYIISDNAKYIQALTGKKTIDTRDIEALKNLGFICELAGSNAITL